MDEAFPSSASSGDVLSRRTMLKVTGGTLATAGLAAGGSDSGVGQTGSEWSQFGSGPANTAHAAGHSGPVEDVAKQWSFPETPWPLSPPAVAGDTVYIGTPGGVVACDTTDGSNRWHSTFLDPVEVRPTVTDGVVYVKASDENGTLYALDAADGSERWSVETSNTSYRSPTVIDSAVYVTAEARYDDRFDLVALDAADGTERWRVQNVGEYRGSPVVANGTVYRGNLDGTVYALHAEDGTEQWRVGTSAGLSSLAVSSTTVFAGGTHGIVYALDANDGSERWWFGTGAGAIQTPTVVDGTVYVGTRAEHNNAVYAVAADDGAEQWRVDLGRKVNATAVTNQTLIVTTDSSRVTDQEGMPGAVYALDTADGSQRWLVESDRKISVPSLTDGTVYVGAGAARNGHVLASGFVYALDDDGSERWRIGTGSAETSPAVVDGALYIGKQDHVCAVDAETGSERWRAETGGYETSSPAVADGTVYVGTWDDGGGVAYALDANDGTERWRVEHDERVVAQVVADGTVYVGTERGIVYAVAAADGSEQWRVDTGGTISESLAVAGGTVYVADSYKPIVHALDASDGRREWRYEPERLEEGFVAPAVANGTVFLGSSGGEICALDADDGTEQWRSTTNTSSRAPAVADGSVYVGGEDGVVYALDADDGTSHWQFDTGGYEVSMAAVAGGTVYLGTSEPSAVLALNAADGTQLWRYAFGTEVRGSFPLGFGPSAPVVAGDTLYVLHGDGTLYALSEPSSLSGPLWVGAGGLAAALLGGYLLRRWRDGDRPEEVADGSQGLAEE